MDLPVRPSQAKKCSGHLRALSYRSVVVRFFLLLLHHHRPFPFYLPAFLTLSLPSLKISLSRRFAFAGHAFLTSSTNARDMVPIPKSSVIRRQTSSRLPNTTRNIARQRHDRSTTYHSAASCEPEWTQDYTYRTDTYLHLQARPNLPCNPHYNAEATKIQHVLFRSQARLRPVVSSIPHSRELQ
ncbi:hypothetical protein BDP81DRAFT_192659 [Colletotrichum phormii]|uniref:Uncharacterized protein n=1 Tax=Colletotrichum phormii TaxID=359342 RepID=A0AAI9ZV96_9PEZI|nr:uncharacterized protein BDP81DRAFT_192659 [Colletotrichum phormii]KAK1638847.1 hypothetical protein BDP81DRAFT_192659 [Colletotrichum phormii]